MNDKDVNAACIGLVSAIVIKEALLALKAEHKITLPPELEKHYNRRNLRSRHHKR